jgi:hypothetical protein
MARSKAKAKSVRKATTKRATRKVATKGDSKSLTVYLMTQTSRGQKLNPREREKDRARVTQFVKEAGAKCMLFGTKDKGGPQQLVSLVWGLSSADQTRFADVVGENGYVDAEMVVSIRKGGP